MALTKEQLLVEAKALPLKEREELIEELRQVVGDDELTPDQLAEIHRRIEALKRGEATLIPGEQVMRELRDSLNRR
jgi:putative addiction module component (TIGR02574 family)